MRTSVYIPSIPRSFNNVPNIIDNYMLGAIKPDEIVVNVSMVNSIDKQQIHNFKIKYPYVKLIETEQRLYAGPNRQQAKDFCTGDVVIYSDDDDNVHPRRVQIVKSYFETMNILVLNHSYVFKNQIVDEDRLHNITVWTSDYLRKLYFPNNNLMDALAQRCYGDSLSVMVHGGAVCIRKELLNMMFWRDHSNSIFRKPGSTTIAEDYDFGFEALFKFNSSIIISAPLYYYSGG